MLSSIVSYVNSYFPRFKTNFYNHDFIKSCVVYKYLYEKYFSQNIEMDQVISRLNDGLTNLRFQTKSVILKNHLISSFALSKFDEHNKQGRGQI